MSLVDPVKKNGLIANVSDIHHPLLRLVKSYLPKVKVDAFIAIGEAVWHEIVLNRTNKLLIAHLNELREKRVAA